MRLVRSAGELESALAEPRRRGRRIALVPTMGNLHQGHFSLVTRARQVADVVAASVFVNPLQFGAGEDFNRYPRTLEADATQLETAGVELLYAPDVGQVYPNGYPPATIVRLSGHLAETLEGGLRPGHFDGVATVVAILFNQVRPDVAVFGEKDWQQLAIIRRVVADLGMGIEILGHPIARAADGLALSSRNQYLSTDERAIAPRLYASLCAVAAELEAGRRDFKALCAEQWSALAAAGFRPQYLEVRRPDLDLPDVADATFVVLVAAHLGTTRLIDNLVVQPGNVRSGA